jgi:tripartite-type tricarboxylate transporter receptor subunit TctC
MGVVLCASAQSFSSQPIRILFPFQLGSSVDLSFRPVVAEMTGTLGQSVLIEARPGANGSVAFGALAQSRGDAHVLAFADKSLLVITPLLHPAVKRVEGADYLPLFYGLTSDIIWIASPSAPFRDLKGMVAYAKANPE